MELVRETLFRCLESSLFLLDVDGLEGVQSAYFRGYGEF